MSIDGNRYRYFGINESKKTKLLAYEYNQRVGFKKRVL